MSAYTEKRKLEIDFNSPCIFLYVNNGYILRIFSRLLAAVYALRHEVRFSDPSRIRGMQPERESLPEHPR